MSTRGQSNDGYICNIIYIFYTYTLAIEQLIYSIWYDYKKKKNVLYIYDRDISNFYFLRRDKVLERRAQVTQYHDIYNTPSYCSST